MTVKTGLMKYVIILVSGAVIDAVDSIAVFITNERRSVMYKYRKDSADIAERGGTAGLLLGSVIMLVFTVSVIAACAVAKSIRKLGNISLFDEHTKI